MHAPGEHHGHGSAQGGLGHVGVGAPLRAGGHDNGADAD